MRKMLMLCVMAYCLPLIALAQDHPKAEIFTGYSYLRGNLDANFNGYDVSATGNLNKWLGVTADFSGHYIRGFNVHTFLFGPKITYRGNGRVNPYVHTLFGAVRLSNFGSDTVFGWAAGVGVDVKIHKSVAVRVIDLTYLLLRQNGFNSSNGRLSAGLVWRFGGK